MKNKEHYNSEDVETNLDRADKRARTLEHFDEFDGDNYEDYSSMSQGEKSDYEREFYDDMEHYKKRGSNTVGAKEKALQNLYKRHGAKGRAFARYRLGVKPSAGSLTGANIQTGAQATFNINITRNSFNINADLPCQVFNVIDCLADLQVLKKYVPAGVTLVTASSYVDANRQNFVFTYQLGAQVDTITISCSEVGYAKFLLATQTDMLRIGRVLYKISNETTQTQFIQKFVVVEQGMYGYGKENPITIQNFINPSDYRKDSLVMNTAFDIDKQTGIIVGMTKENVALAPNTLSLGISVTIFDQWTRKKM